MAATSLWSQPQPEHIRAQLEQTRHYIRYSNVSLDKRESRLIAGATPKHVWPFTPIIIFLTSHRIAIETIFGDIQKSSEIRPILQDMPEDDRNISPVTITAARDDIGWTTWLERGWRAVASNLKTAHFNGAKLPIRRFLFGWPRRFWRKINLPIYQKVSSIAFSSPSYPNSILKQRNHASRTLLESNTKIITHLMVRGAMPGMAQTWLELYVIV
jgi:hypothetical protein